MSAEGLKPGPLGTEVQGVNALACLAVVEGGAAHHYCSHLRRTRMFARLVKATKGKDKGFTLIELLVVVIIIGILAAIAIPIFLNQRKKGVDASIKSDVKQFATQVETYYTDNQSYPASITWNTAGADITVGTEKVTVSEGNVLQYVKNTDGTYKICGYNADGTADTTTNVFKYDSAAGGLQPAKTTC